MRGFQRKCRTALCLLCCLLFLPWGGQGEQGETPAPNVRVLLRRLNLTNRIDLKLEGTFLASWEKTGRMLLPPSGEVTVKVLEDRLVLYYAGAALDCGSRLALTRESTEISAAQQAGMPGLHILPWEGLYPGDLTLSVSEGLLQPVLTVNVEDYLLGVVPYEMSEDFPLEALKAQAVCARTYALSRLDAGKAYDLVDTTNDQVFRPIQPGRSRTEQAVQETAGLVGTSGGELAHCYYGASNGGQTELPSHVWSGAENSRCYEIKDDPYDLENPESVVRRAVLRRDGQQLPAAFLAMIREAVFALPEMAEYVQGEENFRADEILTVKLEGPRFAAPSRLMTRMEITLTASGKKYLPVPTAEPELTWDAEEGEQMITAAAAATPEPERKLSDFQPAGRFTLTLPLFPEAVRALGLSISGADNEIITVSETEDEFRLASGRYGHGVGMSQRGAQWMAKKYHRTFQEILAFYYPGMVLKKAAAGPAAIPSADPVLAGTPGPAATPTPRPTLMPVDESLLPEGGWLAGVEGIEEDSSLNLRAEPSPGAAVLMRLYKHQRLIVLEACADPAWVHVKTDSAEGYVMASFLERIK